MAVSDPLSPMTRSTLLSRARNPEDQRAWRELEDQYRELLVRFCCKRGCQHADAEDVVQIVFVSLTKTLPQFVYDRSRGRFRDYLYRSVRNAMTLWAQRIKGNTSPLDTKLAKLLPAPGHEESAETETLWHEEWVAHHYRLALATIRATLDARTVAMFDRSINGETAADIARTYGITEQAVYASRRRVRARIKGIISKQIHEEDHPNEQATQ